MSKKAHKQHIRLAHKGPRGQDVVYLDAMVTRKQHREIMTFVGSKATLTKAEIERVREMAK